MSQAYYSDGMIQGLVFDLIELEKFREGAKSLGLSFAKIKAKGYKAYSGVSRRCIRDKTRRATVKRA